MLEIGRDFGESRGADDAGRAPDRVRGFHHLGSTAAGAERRQLPAHFGAEQLQQGVGFVGVAHRSFTRKASNNRSSSSSPTARFSQAKTPRVR